MEKKKYSNSKLCDEFIYEAIFDAIQEYKINYLPSRKELISKAEFEIKSTGEIKDGKWLTYAIVNRGDFKLWREKTGLCTKERYQELVEKGRKVWNIRPYPIDQE